MESGMILMENERISTKRVDFNRDSKILRMRLRRQKFLTIF